MHPLLWGQLLANVYVGVSACAGIDDIVDALRDRAAITPDGEPVRAWGFDDTLVRDDRELTRFDLDRATSRHPVMVLHVSGHSAYVNSLLAQRSGITSASIDPPGGRVHRDAGRSADGSTQRAAGDAGRARRSSASSPLVASLTRSSPTCSASCCGSG